MRARILKPGFYENEELARLGAYCRLLYAGLWLLADREGRLEDRPGRIKALLFPYEPLDIEPLLSDLCTHGFIVRYPYSSPEGERRAIAVPAFSSHQTPHHREAPSKIPAPPNTQPRAGHNLGKAEPQPSLPVLVLVSDPVTVTDPVPVSKDQSRGLAPPVSDENLKIITKLAHSVYDQLGLAHPDITEALKDRCAQHRIAYDSAVVRKALDSAAWQRTHKKQHR